jgi:hypothetical protein
MMIERCQETDPVGPGREQGGDSRAKVVPHGGGAETAELADGVPADGHPSTDSGNSWECQPAAARARM